MKLFKLNPAAIVFAVNALVNLAVAWGANLTPDQQGAFTGIVTAVCTIYAAVKTRPIGLQVIVGATTAIVAGLAPFGWHLTANQISSGATVLSLILAIGFHLAHVPTSAVRSAAAEEGVSGL